MRLIYVSSTCQWEFTEKLHCWNKIHQTWKLSSLLEIYKYWWFFTIPPHRRSSKFSQPSLLLSVFTASCQPHQKSSTSPGSIWNGAPCPPSQPQPLHSIATFGSNKLSLFTTLTLMHTSAVQWTLSAPKCSRLGFSFHGACLVLLVNDFRFWCTVCFTFGFRAITDLSHQPDWIDHILIGISDGCLLSFPFTQAKKICCWHVHLQAFSSLARSPRLERHELSSLIFLQLFECTPHLLQIIIRAVAPEHLTWFLSFHQLFNIARPAKPWRCRFARTTSRPQRNRWSVLPWSQP